MGKAKQKKKIEPPEPQTGLGSLGAMFKSAGFRATEPEPNESPAITEDPITPAVSPLNNPARIRFRTERKGRRGKTVTIVSGLNLPSAEIVTLAEQWKKKLGCGASIEEGCIVLHGNQADRVRQLLMPGTGPSKSNS